MATKNLWQKERKQLFRALTQQYRNEGYDIKIARKLAREETEEIMSDELNFVDNLQNDIEEYN